MLFYLDNHLSTAPTPLVDALRRNRPNANANKRRQGLNENYARALMELHTLGVDGGYTQKDVTEVARAFTGWTIDWPRMSASFVFRPAMHDRREKLVLGQRLAANRGMEDGKQVLEILASHPSAARFIATKLVQRFVSDNPPQSLVDAWQRRTRSPAPRRGPLRDPKRDCRKLHVSCIKWDSGPIDTPSYEK